MLKKHDVSSKSSRGKKIMASAKKTSFVIQHQLQNDECEELHHMETVNEERLLQDDVPPPNARNPKRKWDTRREFNHWITP